MIKMAYTDPTNPANVIAKRKEYLTTIMAEVYEAASITGFYTGPIEIANSFQRAGEVVISKLTSGGLGDYSKQKGYPRMSHTLSQETLSLSYDRGASFVVDVLDNAQTGGLDSAVRLASDFMRRQVTPEVDATRIARVAQLAEAASNVTTIIPAASTVVASIQDAINAIGDNYGVSDGINIVFNRRYKSFLDKPSGVTLTKNIAESSRLVDQMNEIINGNKITLARSKLCYDAFTYNDGDTEGETDGGFLPAVNGKEIVAVLSAPNTAQGIVQHQATKYILSDSYPDADGDFFAIRVFHDLVCLSSDVSGLYAIVADTSGAIEVTFEMQGGSAVATQLIADPTGGLATKPTDPTKSGFTFKGWYTSATGSTTFDFTKRILKDTTIYAQWTAS